MKGEGNRFLWGGVMVVMQEPKETLIVGCVGIGGGMVVLGEAMIVCGGSHGDMGYVGSRYFRDAT